MKLDPVPMECAKCKCETTHTVNFAEHTQAAGTVTGTCTICGNTITKTLTGMGRRSTLTELMESGSKIGTYKRKLVNGDF
jgi:hypothetical protein